MRRIGVMAVLGALALGAGGASSQTTAAQLQRAERALVARQAALAIANRAALASRRARVREVEQALVARQAALGGRFRGSAPEPWLQQDPADSLYRVARELLNSRRYADAARRFAEIRERYPRSGYVGDSYYFQALALYREGAPEYTRARELLARQMETYADATTARDARQLQLRLESALARRGDAQAALSVTRSAAAGCDQEDQGLRAMALSALMQMSPDQARPILREVLEDRDVCSSELRKQALFILSRNLGGKSVDLLVDLALTNPDPDPEVRQTAVFWLSQVEGDEALNALLSIVQGERGDPELQGQALFALGQHRDPRASEALRRFAQDSSVPSELRVNAIHFLSQQAGADAAPFLRELYTSLDDPDLKEQVLFALGQSTTAENRAWLLARVRDPNEVEDVRRAALFWAGQSGLEASEALEIYRATTDREMKEQALFVLSRAGGDDAAAVDALMEIARTEKDPELREGAVFWLGRSKDPRVAGFLLELIRGGG